MIENQLEKQRRILMMKEKQQQMAEERLKSLIKVVDSERKDEAKEDSQGEIEMISSKAVTKGDNVENISVITKELPINAIAAKPQPTSFTLNRNGTASVA